MYLFIRGPTWTLLATISVYLVSLQAKKPTGSNQCFKKTSQEVFDKTFGAFRVDYYIQPIPDPWTCFRLNISHDGRKAIVKFMYNEGDVHVDRAGTVVHYPNEKLTYTFDDEPTLVMSIHVDIKPNGIYVIYTCPFPNVVQVILIAYPIGKNLSKEAEEEAKLITSNVSIYKVDHDHCDADGKPIITSTTTPAPLSPTTTGSFPESTSSPIEKLEETTTSIEGLQVLPVLQQCTFLRQSNARLQRVQCPATRNFNETRFLTSREIREKFS